MRQSLDAVGAADIWDETDDTCHLNGTARMGERSDNERRQCRLPLVGYPEFVGMRRLGFPDSRRRQSIADYTGDRLSNRRPDQDVG